MKRNLYIEELGDKIEELAEKGKGREIQSEWSCLVRHYNTYLKYKLPCLFISDLSFIDTKKLAEEMKKAKIGRFVYANASTKAVDDISGLIAGGYRIADWISLEKFAGEASYLSACQTGLIFERAYRKN